jgi:hypothetical protein
VSCGIASFQATTVYVPGGTFSIRYRPSSSVTAKYRCAKTRMNALMCEWMSQNTRTIPGLSNRIDFECPAAYRPRSKLRVFESENTLWYVRSLLRKFTVVPTVFGST